jgi:hypothetical protein
MKMKADFDSPCEKYISTEYRKVSHKLEAISKKINKTDNPDERKLLIAEHKQTKQRLFKTPCKSQTDKKIKYIRYADDCAPRMRIQAA